MISVNERAATIVQQMKEEWEAFGLAVKKLKNGATVLVPTSSMTL